jgi:hypothetical protein
LFANDVNVSAIFGCDILHHISPITLKGSDNGYLYIEEFGFTAQKLEAQGEQFTNLSTYTSFIKDVNSLALSPDAEDEVVGATVPALDENNLTRNEADVNVEAGSGDKFSFDSTDNLIDTVD